MSNQQLAGTRGLASHVAAGRWCERGRLLLKLDLERDGKSGGIGPLTLPLDESATENSELAWFSLT